MANIVIYGAEISGICAAIKAKGNLLADGNDHNIKIIVTNPSGKVGGLATRGGLNCWDVFNAPLMEYDRTEYNKGNKNTKCCQKGTFGYLFKEHLQSYRSDMNSSEIADSYLPAGEMQSMDIILEALLKRNTDPSVLNVFNKTVDNTNIEIIGAMDIVDIDYVTDSVGKKTINKLYLRSVHRSSDGYIRWGHKTRVVEGDYFIDASDDGKLTSALTTVTVGRYDWPESTLEACEKTNIPVARQQVATLYFQVRNLATELFIPYGGHGDLNNADNIVSEYNANNIETPFAIKKYNLAKNSHLKDSDVYWANTFLIFNVDGRAHYRDFTTKFYPKYMLSDSMMRDEAWVKGKEVISSNDFEEALRGFDAFGTDAEIVKNGTEPVVAEQLYIRESVHLPLNPNSIDNDTEADIFTGYDTIPGNYAVTRNKTLLEEGWESTFEVYNSDSRIGLVSYNADIHPYVKGDILKLREKENEEDSDEYDFLNMAPSANSMRPDLADGRYVIGYDFKENNEGYRIYKEKDQNGNFIGYGIPGDAIPAAYLPYEALFTSNVTNLLVAGNAMGICSFSWAEIRVLPNLCVAGDAAGIAIAYAIRKGCTLNEINNSSTHLENIRSILKLDKVKKVDNANDPSVAEYNEKLLVDGKYWWTNDAIVDKTDVLKRGYARGTYDTDNYMKKQNETVS